MARDRLALAQMELVGADPASALLLSRWAVPQLGARVYALIADAENGAEVDELAADYALTAEQVAILLAHWSPLRSRPHRLAQRRRAAARSRPSFIERSQPRGDR